MKSDNLDMKSSPNVLIFADKTSHIYKSIPQEYNKLLKSNIMQSYKKSTDRLEKAINMEAKNIAKKIRLSDRIECLAKTPAFITLKDNKDNFQSSLPCRLMNPSKSELGKINKSILENIKQHLIKLLCVNQWQNSASVIEWFENIEEKKNCTLINVDIREFYLSITETIFDKDLLFAKQYHNISNDNIRLIKHFRKSLLFSNNKVWEKKHTESCFDVTMGSFDGAEECELVGIYMLCLLAKLNNKNECGLYRDDRVLILQNVNSQQIDRMRRNIVKMFKDTGFAIDVETNPKIVGFSDITFNLNNGTYRPYKKPNDLLPHINKSSNHPPQIINQLSKAINERLSRNSYNEEVFNSSKHQYGKAVRDSGYTDFQLKLDKTSTKRTKNIDNATLFGLICHSTEQSPQMLEKGFSSYYVTTSQPLTSLTKYLIRTQ